MRAEGVEPSSPEGHRDLNPARLPIPPRSPGFSVAHDDPGHRRFVVECGAMVAELVYQAEPGRLVLVHTGVPEEFRRRGIGGELVRAALARAVAEQLTVVPQCPFVRRWLRDNPKAAATVTIDWTLPRQPI